MTISDCIVKIKYLTKTNDTSFPAATMLVAINSAYDRVASLILLADGRWEWDDTNQTDLPNATTALVASQQDYQVSSVHLKVSRVEIKDNGATQFRKLVPIDQADVAQQLDNATTGVPQYYDVIGTQIFLYPIPNYSQAASLKVYFQRGPALYTSGEVTTGTKAPGFSSLYHNLIPLWVAYEYWLSSKPQLAQGYMVEIQRLEDQIKRDYSKRDKDDPAKITSEYINHR